MAGGESLVQIAATPILFKFCIIMERKEIIGRLGRYFTLPELVCPHVYNKYSESQIWSFFTTEALETLLVLREEILCKPFIINNWKNGGSYSQRGLRCNVCVLCKEKTMLENRI